MAAEHRIQGLFSDGGEPRASEDESGLRERPRPPRRRESLPDLSGLAVELPDEDDFFEDLPDSDTIPPSRSFRAQLEEEMARAALEGRAPSEPPPLPAKRSGPPPLPKKKDGEPPALPVELTQRRPPALPLLLTRQTVPPDAGRISFGEIARTAEPAPSVRPGAVSNAVALRRDMIARERRRQVARWAGAGAVFVACFAVGVGIMVLAQGSGADASASADVASATPEASRGSVESSSAAAAGAADVASGGEASTAVDAPSGAVQLDEVRVRGRRARESARSTTVRAVATNPEPETASGGDRTANGSSASRDRSAASAGVPVMASGGERIADESASEPQAGAALAEEGGVEAGEAEAQAEPAPELPATPPRAEVLAAIRSVEGEVRACAEGVDHHGVAPVRITVAPSGRVTTAVVQGGGLVGSPAGSCIARAVRGAQFPAFSQDSFAVDYPFTL